MSADSPLIQQLDAASSGAAEQGQTTFRIRWGNACLALVALAAVGAAVTLPSTGTERPEPSSATAPPLTAPPPVTTVLGAETGVRPVRIKRQPRRRKARKVRVQSTPRRSTRPTPATRPAPSRPAAPRGTDADNEFGP